jgi:hypothetical protein
MKVVIECRRTRRNPWKNALSEHVQHPEGVATARGGGTSARNQTAPQRWFVIHLATDILQLLVNLLSVNVVISPRKAAGNRHSRRHPCVIVHGLSPIPNITPNRRTALPALPVDDDAISSKRNVVAWMPIHLYTLRASAAST